MLLLAGLALAGLAAAGAHGARPALVWNTTASAPVGLWLVRPQGPVAVGDWVLVAPPASWLVAGGYVPRGVPLLKRVAAKAGQAVCRDGAEVRIGGALAARARRRGRRAEVLPSWRGCRRLAPGELFLLNPRPDSLDGRYFGPTPASAVIAVVRPLLVRGAP